MLSKVALVAVACCLLVALAGCERQGRYQAVAAHGSTAQEDRVWLVDTEAGRVSLCYEASGRVSCLPQSEAPSEAKK